VSSPLLTESPTALTPSPTRLTSAAKAEQEPYCACSATCCALVICTRVPLAFDVADGNAEVVGLAQAAKANADVAATAAMAVSITYLASGKFKRRFSR
jgi:hypothetical protein